MIIFLSELQKEHLDLLHQHSSQLLVDFCKLTIDFLNNGMNDRKINVAAEKLNIGEEIVKNLIYALAHLIVEGSKHSLSEQNFRSSLSIAGFAEDKVQILIKLFNNKKKELSAALNLLQQRDQSYQDLTWRFEIQVASKSSETEIKPMVAIDFVLTMPKNFGQFEEDILHIKYKQKKSPSTIKVTSSIHDTTAASRCQHIINHCLVQCDIPNLIHITNRLEEALKEAKSQHIRKVQRAL